MVDSTFLLVSLLKRCCRIVAILRFVTLIPLCHPEAKPKDLNATVFAIANVRFFAALRMTGCIAGAMPTLVWVCETAAKTCLSRGKHGTHHASTNSVSVVCFVTPASLCHSRIPLSFPHPFVIPAQAGIHRYRQALRYCWIPACAGMTVNAGMTFIEMFSRPRARALPGPQNCR